MLCIANRRVVCHPVGALQMAAVYNVVSDRSIPEQKPVLIFWSLISIMHFGSNHVYW